jgi:hypothetical protein
MLLTLPNLGGNGSTTDNCSDHATYHGTYRAAHDGTCDSTCCSTSSNTSFVFSDFGFSSCRKGNNHNGSGYTRK